MMRILLAEDDRRLGQITKELLGFENCMVDWAKDGAEALALFKEAAAACYDVVVLDWMLPELDGLNVCKIMRGKYGFQGGIIFVTARGDEDDCVKALECGADDYVVKPFKIKELIARVRAVERRKSKPFVDKIYEKNDIRLDRNLMAVSVAGGDLQLRKKEFQLFEVLFMNMGQILPRETIFEKVWADKPETNPETLESHIYSLRKKLKEKLPGLSIRLVKNIGYTMEEAEGDD